MPATGERIEPRRTAKVIAGVSNGMSVNKVAKYANVNRRTATAIVEANSATIAQRKERLTDLYADIAQRGAERIKEGLEQAPYGSLVVITGMSTDKLLALTQDPQSQLNQHLHVHLEKIDLVSQFNTALHQIKSDNPVIESNGHSVAQDVISVASTEEKQISAKEIEPDPTQDSPT